MHGVSNRKADTTLWHLKSNSIFGRDKNWNRFLKRLDRLWINQNGKFNKSLDVKWLGNEFNLHQNQANLRKNYIPQK
jgi:hypothetical protein